METASNGRAGGGGGSVVRPAVVYRHTSDGPRASARWSLSPAQARLWELETSAQSSGGRGAHGFAIAYHLRGPVDDRLLERAIAAVAARHPALRMYVVAAEGGGEPHFEEIADPGPFLERREHANAAALATPPDLDAQVREEAARALDPGVGRAWRCVLFRQADDEHVLLLHFHHIIADRWSVAVFAGDLAAAYRALAEGGTPFADSAATRRSTVPPDTSLPSAELAAGVAYWKELFAEPAEPLVLPSVRGAQSFAGYAGGRVEAELERQTVDALKALAAAESTTVFAVLLAAFGAVLRAHSGQDDLVVCTPTAGRHRAGTRGVIGFFNNIIPLRLDLRGDPTFAALTGRVTAQARASYAHQDVPFHLIAALPELSTVRLTRCLFTVQNIPGLDLRLPGVTATRRDVPGGAANFDLAIFLEEHDGRLRSLVDYKSTVFQPEVVDALHERFFALLRAVAGAPAARLSELPSYADAAAPEPEPLGGEGHEPARRPRGPGARNMLEQKMIELWRGVLRGGGAAKRGAGVNANTNFFEWGGDSMRAARLMARIKEQFGRELPLATLFEAPTPRQLVAKMSDATWLAPWLSLVPVQTAGTRPPLFVVAGGGGNVINYRIVAKCLGAEQPVYCLQAKGLRSGERRLDTIEEMAAHYLDAVRQFRPAGPYLLAGHSLGAAVAYEMAQRLTADGQAVSFLGLFDHPGPDVRLTRVDWLRFHLINISMLSGPDRSLYIRRGFRRQFRLLLGRGRGRLRGGRPAAGPPAQTKRAPRPAVPAAVDMLEKSLRALREYRMRPFPGRVSLFRARQGSPRILADPHGGWKGMALGGVDVYEVPGTHLSMLEEPHVRSLGAVLALSLDRLAEEAPAR